MEKNLNPIYYLEEAIGGAGARRILKSAQKHKIYMSDIIDSLRKKGGTAKAAATRLRAKGVMGALDRSYGENAMRDARYMMKQIQKRGSELDKKITHRRPRDFVKQFKKDKAKKLNQFKMDEIERLKREKAQRGKDLLDSLR